MPSVRGLDLRHLGGLIAAGPPARGIEARFRDEALDLARRERLVAGAYSYAIVPLTAPAGPVLHAGAEAFDAPRLVPESGELTALACAACTIGPRLEHRVSELFAERRRSLALALDRLGNALLLALCRLMQDRMLANAKRQGLTMAGELRAGDPGLALDAQGAVLRLAQAGTVGVSVGPAHAMRPLKSVSLVLGVGIDLPPARWSRCDDCPSRATCRVALEAAAAAA